MLVRWQVVLPCVIWRTLRVSGWGSDTANWLSSVRSLEGLVTAVDDVVIRNQFRDKRFLISHGTNQLFPRIDAVGDVVILGNVDGIVFSLSHFLEGPGLFAANVLIPGPVALGKKPVGKNLIIAVDWSPELHHDIEDTS